MNPGDRAGEIGDGGDHGRPGFGGRFRMRTIVAAWMEAEASGFVQSHNAASVQIRLYDCARNRLRHGEQAACRFRRSCRGLGQSGMGTRRWVRAISWRSEKSPCLGGDIGEMDEAVMPADDVEQIAMLAG